jgi:tape measure domain-containing protein
MANIIEDIYSYNINTSEATRNLAALIAQVERQTSAVRAAQQGSNEWRAANVALANSTRELGTYMAANANTIEGLRAKIQSLRAGFESATIGSREFRAVQQELITTERQLAQAVSQTGAAAQGSATMFGGLRGAMGYVAGGAALVAAALVAAGVKAIAAASQVADFHIALETMLGSKVKAKQVEAEITAIAAKSPFELSEVQNLTKQLVAYGFSAKEIAPTITQLGNISAGVGKEKLPQLTLALGQVKAAGKLMGGELRQFTEAGVPLLEMLAEQSGKSAGQIMADMKKGIAPSFKEVQSAIAAAAGEGGKFGGLMEKMSQSTSGLWSNMQDGIYQLSAALGERLAGSANGAIAGINGLISVFTDFVKIGDVEKLQQEQVELNALAATITSAANSQEMRNASIAELQSKYPSFFASLNKEIDLNSAIVAELKEVNQLYKLRITAAAAAQIADEKAKTATQIAKDRLTYQQQVNAELRVTAAETEGLGEKELKALYIKKAAQRGVNITQESLDNAGSSDNLTSKGNRLFASFGIATLSTKIAIATRDLDKAIKESADANTQAAKATATATGAQLDKFSNDLRLKQYQLEDAEEGVRNAGLQKDETVTAAAIKKRNQIQADIRQLQKDRNELQGISFEKEEKTYDKAGEKAAAEAAKKRAKSMADVKKAIKDAVSDLDRILEDALRDIQKRALDAEKSISQVYSTEATANIEQVRARFDAMVKAGEKSSEQAVKGLSSGKYKGESLMTTDDKGNTNIDVSKVRDAASKIKDEFKNYVTDQKAAANESIKELSSFFDAAAKTDERLIDNQIQNIQDANARKVAEIERAAAKTQKAFAAADQKIQDLADKGLITQAQADREIAKNAQAANDARLQSDVQLHDTLLKEINDYYKDREAIIKAATHDEATIAQIGTIGLKQAATQRYTSGITTKQQYEDELKSIDEAAKLAELGRTKNQAQTLIDLEEKRQAEIRIQIAERQKKGITTTDLDEQLKASDSKILDLQKTVADANATGLEVTVKAKTDQLDKAGDKLKRFMSLAKNVSDATFGAISKVSAAQLQQIDQAIAKSSSRLNELLSDQKTTNSKQVAIERERLEKLEAERRKAAERQKDIAMVQVVTSSLVAIAEAAAAGGPAAPFTIAATLIALAAGLAAARAGAENAFFEGTDYVPLGNNKRGRDTIPARLHEGEAVIQADRNVQYAPVVRAIRRGEIAPEVINRFVQQQKRNRNTVGSQIDLEGINNKVGAAQIYEVQQQQDYLNELKAVKQEIQNLAKAVKNKPETSVKVNTSARGVFEVVTTQNQKHTDSKNIGKI